MKPRRDWSDWPDFTLTDQGYIVKGSIIRKPFPLHKNSGAMGICREPKTPIFNINMFGIKLKGD